MRERDQPWVMRTYSGHSTARASNALYRTNLAKGQTGLSVAFDLPTQTGYDPGDLAANGEVGKVGVPVVHLGHMRELFADIPLEKMNTSMTINATAAWLLGLYVALADERGIYIGRTCHWKDCRPGVRRSCDALHCGRRPYLHDDLDTIRLNPALVHSPPVTLWPYVERRGQLPADVDEVVAVLEHAV